MLDHYKKIKTEADILQERKEQLFGDCDFYATQRLEPIPPVCRWVKDGYGGGSGLIFLLPLLMWL